MLFPSFFCPPGGLESYGCQVLISTLGESKETSTAVNQRVKAAEEAAVEPIAPDAAAVSCLFC